MKKQKILEKDISELNLSTKINNTLKDNSINTIEDLWKLKRKELKDMKLSDSDITQVIIKLQLYGLDLNKKVY